MIPHEFEIGDIFKRFTGSDVYIWARINDNEMIALMSSSGFDVGDIENVIDGGWAMDYEKIRFEDLSLKSRVLYLEHFPKQKEPEGCTCDITVIMRTGCQCGWMQKERA